MAERVWTELWESITQLAIAPPDSRRSLRISNRGLQAGPELLKPWKIDLPLAEGLASFFCSARDQSWPPLT